MADQMFASTRLTAAAAITPPNPNDTLHSILLTGGATPGALGLTLDGTNISMLPVPGVAAGQAPQVLYVVNERLASAIIAGNVSFLGGLASAVFRFVNTSESGVGLPPTPPGAKVVRLREMWAIRGTRAATGSTTLTYPAQAKLDRLLVLQSTSTGRAQVPTVGSYTDNIEAKVRPWLEDSDWEKVSPALAKSLTTVLTQTLDGAATQDVYGYYRYA